MQKLRYIKDILKLGIAKIVAPILKAINKNNRDIWLIGERKNEAKDNGYHLFKYIRENHPKDKVYYVIDKNSGDIDKLQSLGNVIYHDSIKHYVYYIMSSKLICAHLGSCVPDSPICWKFYNYEMKNKKRIFIQHGITIGNIDSLKYNNTKIDLFVCGSKMEYDFVKSEFGYPEGSVQYLGFARFDNLHYKNEKNQILVMPTWRQWIPSTTWKLEDIDKCREIFLESDYFKRYNSLINNKEIIKLLEKHDIELIFYPHYEMQGYIDLFKTKSNKIVIAKKDEYDVQQLLKESKILITDYSSVAFDFGYMKKPVIYYQFDEQQYYANHYQQGYFVYKEHGFGPTIKDEDEVIYNITKFIEDENYSKNYDNRYCNMFNLNDNLNCKRHYECINNI